MRQGNFGSDAARSRGGRRIVPQKTLKTQIHCTGVGLHSGAKVSMTLKPAAPNAGITIVRTDVDHPKGVIPATWERVVDTRMCTVLGNDWDVSVGTVEHLMAALSGIGIDNVTVEVDGPELPIMDGSAAPFVFLIECAGTVDQARARRAIRVLEPISVRGDRWSVELRPADGFSVEMDIDFKSAVVAHQSLAVGLVNGTFKKELARARTFGFLDELEALQAAGLARGGSLDNAIVVGDNRVLNAEGLRYDDEFVRHKALDAVGDLYLAGAQIIGRFHGVRSGHTANNRLLRALFANADAWTWDVIRPDQAEAVRYRHAWQGELAEAAVGG